MKQCGIYAITNNQTGQVYIGQSINLNERLAQHKRDLRRGSCCNQRLQRAWNKYGSEAFSFDCIEIVPVQEDLAKREQHWIDQFMSSGLAYNLCPSSESCAGLKHTEDTISKRKGREPWNKGLKGYKIRPAGEARNKKIGDAQRGSRNHNYGKSISEDVKEKIRASNQGSKCYLAKLTEEQVIEIKIALLGGAKGTELAKKYGVDKVQISAIKTGKTWKHVCI